MPSALSQMLCHLLGAPKEMSRRFSIIRTIKPATPTTPILRLSPPLSTMAGAIPVPLIAPCMIAADITELERMHTYAIIGLNRIVHNVIIKTPAIG